MTRVEIRIDPESLRRINQGVEKFRRAIAAAVPTMREAVAVLNRFRRVYRDSELAILEAAGAPRCPRKWRRTLKGRRRWRKSREFRRWSKGLGRAGR